MQGLIADSYFANTSNCFERVTNFTFVQIPQYEYNISAVYNQSQVNLTDTNMIISGYYSISVYTTRLI